MRAHPVRAARLAALRARVDRRRRDLVLRPALVVRECDCFCLEGDEGGSAWGRRMGGNDREGAPRNPLAQRRTRSLATASPAQRPALALVKLRSAGRASWRWSGSSLRSAPHCGHRPAQSGPAGDLGRQRERERVARPGREVELVPPRRRRATRARRRCPAADLAGVDLERGSAVQAAHAGPVHRRLEAQPQRPAAPRGAGDVEPTGTSAGSRRTAGRRSRTARSHVQLEPAALAGGQPSRRELEDIGALGHALHGSAASLLVLLAVVLELALEHLAGRVARQLVDELDVARDLVAGQVGLDVLLDLVLGEVLALGVTTTAFSRWPNSSSSTPNTAASAILSWPASRSSTSCGKTFSPPETIMSSSRPSTNRRPSSSKWPTSPEDIRPSMTSLLPPPPCSPRTASRCRRRCGRSPPCSTSLPSSSKSLTIVPRGGLPAVPGASRRSSGVAIVAQATSVEP